MGFFMLRSTQPEPTKEQIAEWRKNPSKKEWIEQQIAYWKSQGYDKRTPDGMDFEQFEEEYSNNYGGHKIKNIYGREMRDPNLMRKDIKVKQATITPARRQGEMGNKLVEIWIQPLSVSCACPHCHYYSVVESPSGIYGPKYTEKDEIELVYKCEWCNKHFTKFYTGGRVWKKS